MPQLLFPDDPRVMVAPPTRQQHAWQTGENTGTATEREKEEYEMMQVCPDMDFFADEYSFTVADSASLCPVGPSPCGEDKGKRQPLRRKALTFQNKEKNVGNVTVGCDVCLGLCAVTGVEGEGRYVIHIPWALQLSTVSPGRKLSPKNDCPITGKVQKVYENEEEGILSDRGAAWSECDTIPIMCEAASLYDDEAARSAYNIRRNNSFYGTTLIGEKKVTTEKNAIQDFNHRVTDGFTTNLYATRLTNTEIPLYVINLPKKFVLSLRLPSDIERKLTRWYKREVTVFPPPPTWLLAFLYTTRLRCHNFPQSASVASPKIHGGMEEEASAMSRLEGLCIVALNILAQMGRMQWQQMLQEENADEVAVAQRSLLGDGGIFSDKQEEQIQRWLQRYMPLGVHNDDDEDMKMFGRERYGSPSWPSAVCVVFHISLDIARVLFPSLLTCLESTILAALRPLLEAQCADTVRDSSIYCFPSNASSLRQSPDRRQALVLLTQTPTSWWDWWRGNVRDTDKRYNGSCCTTVISASRSFGALRVLQYFVLLYPTPNVTDTQWALDEGETLEVTQFLLAGPSLFNGILLDREVTGVLERAFKEIVQVRRVPLEQQYHNEQVDLFQSRVTCSLMRCFLLFICWLTFRPEGYSRSLAQNHLGSLLHLAISRPQRQGAQQDIKEEEAVLLGVCCHKYFSLVSTLIRSLREQYGTRHSGGNRANPSRVNPWRQLRYGENMGRIFAGDDDCTSNTTRGHRSVGSFHSANTMMETSVVPSQQILTTTTTTTSTTAVPNASSNTAKNIDCDTVFSFRELRTLRRNIRELRQVLRVLEADVFEGCEERFAADALVDGSVGVLAGTKRRREEDEPGKESELEKENACFMSQDRRCEQRLGVSPYFAHHLFGRPESVVWDWHLECSGSSGDDVTETSTSESGSSSR